MNTEELERELADANERIWKVTRYADWMASIISRYDRAPASEKVQVVEEWKRFKEAHEHD